MLKDLAPKKIMLGVIDLSDPEVETPQTGRRAHPRRAEIPVAGQAPVPAPDCGMKYLPRATAFGKLKAMCDAAAMVRREIG